MPWQPPDRELVAQLLRAAADNAIQLAEEATLLDDNGHAARAFALTVLAAEELGKAVTCAITLAHAESLSDWEPFRMVFGSGPRHQTKILAALFLEERFPELAGLPVDDLARGLAGLVAGDLNAAKMRALYVDLDGDATATPEVIAGDKDARQRARALRRSVVGWAVALSVGFDGDSDSAK